MPLFNFPGDLTEVLFASINSNTINVYLLGFDEIAKLFSVAE